MDIQSNRVTVEAFATDLELRHAPYSVGAIIRERIHTQMVEALENGFLQSESINGGVRYWLDLLMMPPQVMVELVQKEATRQLKEFGYAVD